MRRGIDRAQLRREQEHDRGQEQPGQHERRANTERRHERRGDRRTDGERCEDEAFEHAEDAAEHLVGGRPLQERHAGDVDERVADADDREEDERKAEVRPRGDERHRHAPEEHAETEVGGEALAPCERCDRERAEHAADAERRVQPPDAAVAGVEQPQRDDDDKHLEDAGDEGLRTVEADDDAQRRLGGDGAKAREHRRQQRLGLAARRRMVGPQLQHAVPPTTRAFPQ